MDYEFVRISGREIFSDWAIRGGKAPTGTSPDFPVRWTPM
jgi:hypothetical protein